jgi:hypothetical protein
MSRRARLGFVAACLLIFALIAAFITWGPPSVGPSARTPATVTRAPGAPRVGPLGTVSMTFRGAWSREMPSAGLDSFAGFVDRS